VALGPAPAIFCALFGTVELELEQHLRHAGHSAVVDLGSAGLDPRGFGAVRTCESQLHSTAAAAVVEVGLARLLVPQGKAAFFALSLSFFSAGEADVMDLGSRTLDDRYFCRMKESLALPRFTESRPWDHYAGPYRGRRGRPETRLPAVKPQSAIASPSFSSTRYGGGPD
jgi:hypothetical protein